MRLLIRQITIILLTIPLAVFGQIKGVKEHKWADKPKPTPIHTLFATQDAYIISERQSINITLDTRGIYMYTNVKRKIKILTQNGIDNYARVILPKSAGRRLSLLDARTIKQDGNIVDLEISDIKEINLTDDDKLFDKNKYLIFSIPGVEKGDEIEIVAGYGGYGIGLGQDIYLHKYLSVAKSEAIIRTMKSIELDIRFYNNLEYPKVNETSEELTYTWISNDLPSMLNQPGSIPTLELPYISYALKKIHRGPGMEPWIGVGDDWTSVFDHFGSSYLLLQTNKNEKALDDLLDAIWFQTPADSTLKRMKIAHEWLNKNMKVKDLPEESSNNTLSSYIESRVINESNMCRIYHYLLKKIPGDYFFCLARDFFDGPIDYNFVAYQQVEKILFSFKDETGSPHYLTPMTERDRFEIDEIDDDLQGTKCVAINLRNKKDVAFVKLPTNSVIDNFRTRQCKVTFNFEADSVNMLFNETLQGIYSTNYRNIYISADEDNKLHERLVDIMKTRNQNFRVDSAFIDSYENTFPFAFKLKYQIRFLNSFTEIDKGLYSFSIQDLFYHQIDEPGDTSRIMDYHFNNLGKDVFKYYLTFEKPVKLQNGDALKKILTRSYANYILEFTQVNPTTILIESTWMVKNSTIKKSEYSGYSALYEEIKSADNEPVIISVSP